MNQVIVLSLVVLSALPAFGEASPSSRGFKKIQVTDQFWAEGADFGDFNHDGVMDVCAGPFWYEGPAFKTRHEFYPANASFKRPRADGSVETIPGFEGGLGTNNAYSDCFLTYAYDFNGDGWTDILVYGFPGTPSGWFENPKGREGHWQWHVAVDMLDNESPGFADVTGDGKPEILCCSHEYIGYAEADWQRPAAPWTFRPISPKGGYHRYSHGLGSGDLNGDGRADIVEKDCWWEQPAVRTNNPVWIKHPFAFAADAAQMLVYDVTGDGLNDVITSLQCHGYGLAWYEQVREAGSITFRQHLILNKDAAPNRDGVQFSQAHGLVLADVDGDGLKDVVTGKRFWAHGKDGPDPGSNDPAMLYWFKLVRPEKGRAEFKPCLVDNDSGVGTQVSAGFNSSKELPDIVVGNKKGVFVFQNQTKADTASGAGR